MWLPTHPPSQPQSWSLYLSFCKYSATGNRAPDPIGIANYSRILSDRDTWQHFGTTATLMLPRLAISAGSSIAMTGTLMAPTSAAITKSLFINTPPC